MGRAELSQSSKYYIPANLYKQCVYFVRQYPEWAMELEIAGDASRAIRYDTEKVQTTNDFDSTSAIAMRRHAIAQKKSIVDAAIKETVPEVYAPWVLFGVTTGQDAYMVEEKSNHAISRSTYLRYRRAFFWCLSKKI